MKGVSRCHNAASRIALSRVLATRSEMNPHMQSRNHRCRHRAKHIPSPGARLPETPAGKQAPCHTSNPSGHFSPVCLCMQDTETPTTKPQGRGKSSNSSLSADICLLYVVLRMQTCCSGVCRTYTVPLLCRGRSTMLQLTRREGWFYGWARSTP